MRPRSAIAVMVACILAGATTGAIGSRLSPAPAELGGPQATATPSFPAPNSPFGPASLLQDEDLFTLGWAPEETMRNQFADDGPNQISPCQPLEAKVVDLAEQVDVRRVDYVHNGMYLGELAAQSPTQADAAALAEELVQWHLDCATGSVGKYEVSPAHRVDIPTGQAHWYQFNPTGTSPPGFGGVVQVGNRSAMFAVNRESLTVAQLNSITEAIAQRLA